MTKDAWFYLGLLLGAVEDHPWIKVAAKRYREYQPGEAGHHQRRAALEMKS